MTVPDATRILREPAPVSPNALIEDLKPAEAMEQGRTFVNFDSYNKCEVG
jgi:hypothetical protein